MKKIVITYLILFLASSQSMAVEEGKFTPDDVKKFVEEIGNKIVGIANETSASETKKREKIIAAIDEVIDTNWIAKFVLGKNYKIATDEQKSSFIKLYRGFMINTYGPKFKNYNGRRFTVSDVAVQNGFYIAKAEFLPRESNVAISVDFRVKEKEGRLMVLDFVAEGVSLIETQRSEFNSAISQKGMDKFLEDFAARVKILSASKK